MTDDSLDDTESPGTANRLWLVLFALCVVALVAAAALIFQSRNDDSDEPADVALQLGWAAPEGEETVGSVILGIGPAAAGQNVVEVDIDPVPDTWLAAIDTVQLDLLPYRGSAEAGAMILDLSGDSLRASKAYDFSGSDAWEIRVSGNDARLATFFVLLPDPNVYGNDEVALLEDDPEAADLFDRASAAVAGWHRVRYVQQLSDGEGLAVVSFREVNDGADGSEPAFRYVTPNGLEAFVIGTRAWTHYPDEDWEVSDTNSLIPPSEWGGEYEGSTGFQIGPMSETAEGPCRVITFVVPGDERQAIAWYAWCIDEETGNVFRDSMIARAHYMITEFSDFNGEVPIVLPPDAAAASPESIASPSARQVEAIDEA